MRRESASPAVGLSASKWLISGNTLIPDSLYENQLPKGGLSCCLASSHHSAHASRGMLAGRFSKRSLPLPSDDIPKGTSSIGCSRRPSTTPARASGWLRPSILTCQRSSSGGSSTVPSSRWAASSGNSAAKHAMSSPCPFGQPGPKMASPVGNHPPWQQTGRRRSNDDNVSGGSSPRRRSVQSRISAQRIASGLPCGMGGGGRAGITTF